MEGDGDLAKEECDIRTMRGVTSFDYDGAAVFVRADVDAAAGALGGIRRVSQWERNIANREVELAHQCFFVLRLSGHTWTCIYGRDGDRGSGDSRHRALDEEDARLLSARLGTRGIYYVVSDTACALGYWIYDNGRLVERLETGEAYEIGEWMSELHEEVPDGDTEEWIDRLFREQDALEPGISFTHFAGYILHEPGHKITVRDPDGICERLDFLAV